MDHSDSTFSQPDSSCLIVPDSQEDDSQFADAPEDLYSKLSVLNAPSARNYQQQIRAKTECSPLLMPSLLRSPHSASVGSASPARACRSMKGGQNQSKSSTSQGSTSGQNVGGSGGRGAERGPHGLQGAGSSTGPGGSGGGRGGGSSGGGSGDGNNNGDDGEAHEEEEEEEDEADSSSSEHGHPVAVTPQVMPLHVEHVQHLAGDPAVVEPPVSDSESGISDAPTAVVSDTEGHGQVIQPRHPVFASPARSSASSKRSALSGRSSSSRRGGSRGRSQPPSDSSTSSLSSFTSGSDSDHPGNRTVIQRKVGSSGEDATAASSTSKRADTERESKDSSTDDDITFPRHPPRPEARPAWDEDNNLVRTPSQTFGSLSFSQHVQVPETEEELAEEDCVIPPSAEAYGSYPLVIPCSQTLEETTSAITSSKKETHHHGSGSNGGAESKSGNGSSSSSSLKPAVHSIQEYQPSASGSYPTPEESGRMSAQVVSSEVSSEKSRDKSPPVTSADSAHLHLQYSVTQQHSVRADPTPHAQQPAAETSAVGQGISQVSHMEESQDFALHYSPSQASERSHLHVSQPKHEDSEASCVVREPQPDDENNNKGEETRELRSEQVSTLKTHRETPEEAVSHGGQSLRTGLRLSMIDSPKSDDDETKEIAKTTAAHHGLTLDMIETQESSETSLPQFILDRPVLPTTSVGPEVITVEESTTVMRAPHTPLVTTITIGSTSSEEAPAFDSEAWATSVRHLPSERKTKQRVTQMSAEAVTATEVGVEAGSADVPAGQKTQEHGGSGDHEEETHQTPPVGPLRRQFTLESENRKARKALRGQKSQVGDPKVKSDVTTTPIGVASPDSEFTALRHAQQSKATADTRPEAGQDSAPKSKPALSPIPVEPPLQRAPKLQESVKVKTSHTSRSQSHVVTTAAIATGTPSQKPHSYPRSSTSRIGSSAKRNLPLRDFLVESTSSSTPPSEKEHEVTYSTASAASRGSATRHPHRSYLAKKVKGRRSSHHVTPAIRRLRQLEHPPRPSSAPQPMSADPYEFPSSQQTRTPRSLMEMQEFRDRRLLETPVSVSSATAAPVGSEQLHRHVQLHDVSAQTSSFHATTPLGASQIAAQTGGSDGNKGRTNRIRTIRIVTLIEKTTVVTERIEDDQVVSCSCHESLRTVDTQISQSESFSTPSPSRNTSYSPSSGDLGDISSISKSTSSLPTTGSLSGSTDKTSSSSTSHPVPSPILSPPMVQPVQTPKRKLSSSTSDLPGKALKLSEPAVTADVSGVGDQTRTSDQAVAVKDTSDPVVLATVSPPGENLQGSTSTSSEIPCGQQVSLEKQSSSLFSSVSDKRLSEASSDKRSSYDRRSSESLFSNVSGKRTSWTSTSSTSVSSFMTSDVGAPGEEVSHRDDVFSKPLPPKSKKNLSPRKAGGDDVHKEITPGKSPEKGEGDDHTLENIETESPEPVRTVSQKKPAPSKMTSEVEVKPESAADVVRTPKGRGRGSRRGRTPASARGRKATRKTTRGRAIAEEDEPSVLEGEESRLQGDESSKSGATDPQPSTSVMLETPVTHEPGTIPAGTAVYAMWKDKFFYPGHVVVKEKSGKYSVTFEDGDNHMVKESNLLLVDLLEPTQAVLAEGRDGWHQPAIILEAGRDEDAQPFYEVQFEDGEKCRLSRGRVILNSEQAADLQIPSLCPAYNTDLGNVSLDNLVEGKRKRDTKTMDSPSTATPSTLKSEKGGTKDSTLIKESGGGGTRTAATTGTGSTAKKPVLTGGKRASKRRLLPVEPTAASTPTPKRKMRFITGGAEEEASPSSFTGVYESPQSVRRKHKKSKVALFVDDKKGPIPADGSMLFCGMAFLLTHVERTESQKRQHKRLAQQGSLELSTTTDESSTNLEEEDEVPFDKEHLMRQIEAGGGVVLSEFNAEHVAAAGEAVLISDTFQRTIKYFMSLASGLPCISHVWIRDCCRTSARQDYRSYILPAGIGIETNKLFEWKPSVDCLKDLVILVTSDESRFCDTWIKVLKTAGCTVITKLPARSSLQTDLMQLDYVVTDRTISQSYFRSAQILDAPVVSSEWVIQVLITGHRVDPDGHPRYHHNYREKTTPSKT